MNEAATLDEKLFVFMMLGDDRAVHATYLMGTRQSRLSVREPAPAEQVVQAGC